MDCWAIRAISCRARSTASAFIPPLVGPLLQLLALPAVLTQLAAQRGLRGFGRGRPGSLDVTAHRVVDDGSEFVGVHTLSISLMIWFFRPGPESSRYFRARRFCISLRNVGEESTRSRSRAASSSSPDSWRISNVSRPLTSADRLS